MSRHVNEKTLKLLQRFEGLKLRAYKLPGEKYYTIGWGHSFDSSIKANTVWTYEQAEEALKKDLEKFEGYVEKYVTGVTLNDNQFGALVSYCYNRGLGKTDGSNGLRQLIKNSKTIDEYAKNIVVYWGSATKYKKGLVSRRKAEQELFLTPVSEKDQSSEDIRVEPEAMKLSDNKANIKIIQKWLNEFCGPIIKDCKACGKALLVEDGVFGNKTKAAFTVVLQLYLNELGAGLVVDGDFGNKTYCAVRKYVHVTNGSYGEIPNLVKRILVSYGYGPEDISTLQTSTFGSGWVIYLKKYQKDHNLIQDGEAGQVFFKTSLMLR